MRVRDLCRILRDIERIFAVSGARSQKSAISELAGVLEQRGEQGLDKCLKGVEEELTRNERSLSASYIHRLEDAGLAEDAFRATMTMLETDQRIRKADLVRI